MIRSMTAYATHEERVPQGQLTWELRAVNHRFLELGLRLPEEFRSLEPRLRERATARVARGKLDVSLRFRAAADIGSGLKLNSALAAELARAARELGAHMPDLAPGTRLEALTWPGMLIEAESDLGSLHGLAVQSFERALDDFVAAREREGARLAGFLGERLDAVEAIVARVRVWLPDIRAALRAKLEARLAELKLPLDPGRLEQELVLGLQKLDVDEELDRLSAHVAEARRVIVQPEPAGRRLDFLLQEFNRESNTLGSKSVDQRSSQAAVELKVLIEQLREQVQNLE
jgi:uncharacterized protein (TIGR00255 family)